MSTLMIHKQNNAGRDAVASKGRGLFAAMRLFLIAALPIMLSAAAASAGEKSKDAETLKFPHAGIQVDIPSEFSLVKVEDPYDIMRAEIRDGKEVTQALSVSALPVKSDMTADKYADMMEKELRNNLAVRNLKILKKVPITIASHKGTARSMSYNYRGVKTIAARVYFIRTISPGAGAVCYMLTSEASPESQDKLLPALDKLLKSVKLIQIRHPIESPVGRTIHRIKDHVRGFAVPLPLGWFVQNSDTGITLAQTDYLAGGQVNMTMSIFTDKVAPGTTAKSYAELKVRKLKLTASGDAEDHIVSRKAAKTGDMDSYQVVIRIKPQAPKTSPATQPEEENTDSRNAKNARPWIIINRTACTATQEKSGKSYMMVLVCRGNDPEPASAIMEKVAGEFTLLETAKGPATEPAAGGEDENK